MKDETQEVVTIDNDGGGGGGGNCGCGNCACGKDNKGLNIEKKVVSEMDGVS
jgi:hypothetical protein